MVVCCAPIGKENGVILVVWVFWVFFVDRTMLDSKCVLVKCLDEHVLAEEVIALLLVLARLLDVADARRSFHLGGLGRRQEPKDELCLLLHLGQTSKLFQLLTGQSLLHPPIELGELAALGEEDPVELAAHPCGGHWHDLPSPLLPRALPH